MKFKKTIFFILMMFVCASTLNIKVMAKTKTKTDTGVAKKILALVGPQNKKTTNKKTNSKKNVVHTASLKGPAYSKEDLRLMSAIIFCEAGGECYAGKLAVGIVITNREESKIFPNTIKSVIYQKYQFQPTRNGSMTRALKEYDTGKFKSANEKACIKAAKEVLNGKKSVSYKNKKINLEGFKYFSGRLYGSKLKIGNHKFK